MRKALTVVVLSILFINLLQVEAFGAKKKQVTSISAIYEIDSWVGTTFELFLKEYKLKAPKKVNLTFANTLSEFYALAKVEADIGAITVEGTIIVSSERLNEKNRVALLKELMRITLIENKKGKDADKIINEFFKKHKIK
ncbi:hypothetical protein [Fervidobacterium thailandense]|uniref:Uncharacterized protein n=1 Tax=Fervidobacterium thailandense TaxID=1008305 RepID=A0A1E3G0N8_9BACT|nr:hypothetical protein [Fervidobacterium thailandense]ODN29710.1 hypothetical protein A4H02_09230 [Fervidobacterium thailandense]